MAVLGLRCLQHSIGCIQGYKQIRNFDRGFERGEGPPPRNVCLPENDDRGLSSDPLNRVLHQVTVLLVACHVTKNGPKSFQQGF